MAWNKNKPAGNQKVRLSDEEIRANNEALETGFGEDHDFLTGGGQTGEHKAITLQEQASDPSAVANKGFLYTKDVSGVTVPFYRDSGGTVSGVAIFPAGTKMLFYQNAAPPGWTIDTSLNDKLVFVTKGSGAGGETGGQAHSTGTWTQPNHVLTEAELPSHAHSYESIISATVTDQRCMQTVDTGKYVAATKQARTSGGTGSGSAHNHGTTWRPAAYNCIIATKA